MLRAVLHKWSVFGLLVGAISAPGVSLADPLTFAYEGIVNESSGGALDALLGETLRFEFTFDSEAEATDLGYLAEGVVISVGGLTYTGTDTRILAGVNLTVLDYTLVGPMVGDFAAYNTHLVLANPLDPLDGVTGLPLIPPDPSSFSRNFIHMEFINTSEILPGYIIAEPLSIAPVAVPEPSEWLPMIVVIGACLVYKVRYGGNRSIQVARDNAP